MLSSETENRVRPSNLRVGATPGLALVKTNVLRRPAAVFSGEQGVVDTAFLASTNTERSGTALEVGASSFDAGSQALKGVAAAAIAGVCVERVGGCQRSVADQEKGRDSASLYNV
jgi:hypothetical protein